jgi:hypothetical protein
MALRGFCWAIGVSLRRILEHKLALLAAVEQLEPQPLSVPREARRSGEALLSQTHAAEAEHGRLHQRSSRRAVDAMLGIQAQVFEVYEHCLHIEVIRHIQIPHTTRESGLHAGR